VFANVPLAEIRTRLNARPAAPPVYENVPAEAVSEYEVLNAALSNRLLLFAPSSQIAANLYGVPAVSADDHVIVGS
jgi:hypothetical protein